MSQAFISYHRAQRKLARLIAHRVAADGHSVWWDRGDRPGDSWSEAVSTALANSACVIVIWSRQSAASPWVLGEATAGYGRGALICVRADGTVPPSPFDRATTVDMQGWEGEAVDLAWIRLRDPLRAKMTTAEKVAVAEAPLPPARPAPVRVGFSSTADLRAPPPAYEERRGSPVSTLLLLALTGLGAAGWYYRDEVGAQALIWQAALTPPQRAYAPLPEPAPPIIPASATTPAVTPPDTTEAPLEPVASSPVATPQIRPPVPAMTRTYEDWRDTFVPAPILRTLPRAPAERPVTPAPPDLRPQDIAAAPQPPSAPVAPRLDRVMVREGRLVDVDGSDSRQRTDLWFGPDASGAGLYLGVTNGARVHATTVARASAKSCVDALSRNPIPLRELEREGALCLRSTDGTLSAWRVEAIERGETGRVLQLVAIGP